MEPGFEGLKITLQPRQVGRPTGHISHTGQDLLRGSTSAADRLAGEPDANDADVVEILAFQSGLTMPLTGLGRLAEGVSVAPPVLSATHVWITRGNRAAMARLARSGANPTLETRVTCFTEKEIYAAGDRGCGFPGGTPTQCFFILSGYAGEPEGNAAQFVFADYSRCVLEKSQSVR